MNPRPPLKARLTPFEKRFLERCKTRGLIEKGDRVLIALSGGSDSVALLKLLRAVQPYLKLSLAAAHCNFQLRGKESDDDEAFCQALCQSLGIECFAKKFDAALVAAREKTSIEETARNLRYRWFAELMRERGFNKLATAHQRNDNAETILFNLFRGASLLGLAGIPERRGDIIRPALHLTREDLRNYLAETNSPFRDDSSNASLDFDRNFIRLRVIPLIEERFGSKFLQNLSRLSENAAELQAFVESHIEKLSRRKGLSFKNDSFDVAALKRLTAFEQKELFKRALAKFGIEPSAQALSRLAGLLNAQSGRKIALSARVEAVWKKDRLMFVAKDSSRPT
ncbi:MAG: tRNA lysidine(34) synthetase TilS [Chloroherpetonaceae bacterium]|nr:tRNA lysidine(34) synthetase TilS [Chloroherpetonaceae bacterium]MDW8438815.1 tRNA lysidine(34) synthetase TilS [Chloroherpetonaceae bacterium]